MNWILRNARLPDRGDLTDIALAQGEIAAIAPNLPADADQEWDVEGRVVLPGLVDLHTHLDKCYLRAPNHSGTLMEAIEVWRQEKHRRSTQTMAANARRALHAAILNGVTAMRSHVDTADRADLATVEALLNLREEMRGRIDLQFVALGDPDGTAENREVLATALTMGFDLIGGAPAITDNPPAAVDAAFALAEKTGKPLDLHIDETEDPQMRTLEQVAERTRVLGLQGRVTAGHCCSLAFMDDTTAARIVDLVAQAAIHVVTLPVTNLVLVGRGMRPAPRGLTRVEELHAHGVAVSAASDNVQDPFNPLGNHDLLHIAAVTAAAAHLTSTAGLRRCLDMVTTIPAQAMGSPVHDLPIGLSVGAAADLVIVDCRDDLEAVVAPPLRLGTFKEGRLIVRTTVQRDWA